MLEHSVYRVWASLAVIVFAAACGRTSDDAAAPAPRTRLVSCSPEISAILSQLGAGEDVVGADARSLELPGLGAAEDLGARCERRLAGAAGDAQLVLLLGTPEGVALAAELEARARRVLVLEPRSLNEVVAAHHRLAALVGRETAATLTVAGLTRPISAIAVRRDGKPRLRVVWVLEREPLAVVGASGMLHELLELGGGENGFHGALDPRLLVSAEQIAAAAPDLVLDSSAAASGAPLALPPGIPVRAFDAALAALPALDVVPRVQALHAALYPDEPNG